MIVARTKFPPFFWTTPYKGVVVSEKTEQILKPTIRCPSDRGLALWRPFRTRARARGALVMPSKRNYRTRVDSDKKRVWGRHPGGSTELLIFLVVLLIRAVIFG